MITINAKLDGHALKMAGDPVLASGSVQADRVHFEFDEAWQGLAKIALFWRRREDTAYAVTVDVNSCALIPAEVLAGKHKMQFGVYGIVPGETTPRITSTLLTVQVPQGAWTTDIVNPGQITPTIIEEFVAEASAAITGSVRYDGPQELTGAQHTQAQLNIGLHADLSDGFISGYYVSTPTPGTAVTAIPLTAHEYYRYQLVDVSAGDVLEITGTVGTAADNVRLWSFWRREDEFSLRLISQSETSAEASHLRLVAPDDGVFAFTVYPSQPYVLYRETHTELTRKRIITVGKTVGCDYDSIQQAVNVARDYDTILVFPGVYAEHVNCINKDITIIGTSRDECVLQYSAMNYGTAPLEMARGHLANIVIQGTTQGETTDPNGHAYCLHIEWNQMYSGTLLVENVRFMNAAHHAVGIGMRPYCTIEFRGCQFLALLESGSAFYIHDWEDGGSKGDGTDRSMQQIRLIGNSFENYGLNVYTMDFQSEELQEGAALLTAQNNIVTNHVSPDYTVGGRMWLPNGRRPIGPKHFLDLADWVLLPESAENSDEKLNAPKTSAQKTAARAAIGAADGTQEQAFEAAVRENLTDTYEALREALAENPAAVAVMNTAIQQAEALGGYPDADGMAY